MFYPDELPQEYYTSSDDATFFKCGPLISSPRNPTHFGHPACPEKTCPPAGRTSLSVIAEGSTYENCILPRIPGVKRQVPPLPPRNKPSVAQPLPPAQIRTSYTKPLPSQNKSPMTDQVPPRNGSTKTRPDGCTKPRHSCPVRRTSSCTSSKPVQRKSASAAPHRASYNGPQTKKDRFDGPPKSEFGIFADHRKLEQQKLDEQKLEEKKLEEQKADAGRLKCSLHAWDVYLLCSSKLG